MGKAEKKTNYSSQKKRPVKGHRGMPISAADAEVLGFECETYAHAEVRAALPGRYAHKRPGKRLKEVFKRFPELKNAFERGRFLRDLKELAGTVVSISQAARKLNLPGGGQQLRELLDSDPQAADIWESERLKVYVESQKALVEKAKEGNQAAIRAIEGMLRAENIQASISADFAHVKIEDLCKITGKTRQTIHEWHTKLGLSRNSDKTYDLSEFFIWFERFTGQKMGKERPAAAMNPYQARRVTLMDIEIDKQRAKLLDRPEVLAGIAARYERLVSSAKRLDDLAAECNSADNGQVRQILGDFFESIIERQKEDFEELKLPAAAMEKFIEMMQVIKDQID